MPAWRFLVLICALLILSLLVSTLISDGSINGDELVRSIGAFIVGASGGGAVGYKAGSKERRKRRR